MILYVDETESDNLFIVAGLLVNSKQSIEMMFRKFKKKASKNLLSEKAKAILFKEFKSTLMDRDYPRLKKLMLSFLQVNNYRIFYGCYKKNSYSFNQVEKEKTYISLLCRIIESINEDLEVIFDAFNKNDFESRIVERIKRFKNVDKIQPVNSETDPGIKVIDNVCSVLRLKECGDDTKNFYEIVEMQVKKV